MPANCSRQTKLINHTICNQKFLTKFNALIIYFFLCRNIFLCVYAQSLLSGDLGWQLATMPWPWITMKFGGKYLPVMNNKPGKPEWLSQFWESWDSSEQIHMHTTEYWILNLHHQHSSICGHTTFPKTICFRRFQGYIPTRMGYIPKIMIINNSYAFSTAPFFKKMNTQFKILNLKFGNYFFQWLQIIIIT